MLLADIPGQCPLVGKADLTRLLRDNDRQGIRHFRNADAGSVPGTQVLIHLVLGQRQIAGSGDDPVPLYDRRSVVQRRVLFKNIDQQLARHLRVYIDPGPGELLKGRRLLDDDQRACPDPCHLDGSPLP